MKKLVIGILAHVDAGKTTLSEELLYLCGEIRKIGRVDHGDAFLDTYELEKERGITIFSKQALLKTENMEVTLLDTPGHVDFSAEMERTLQVLDYAILVINGMDGVQSHTMTLWRLLERYQIPTFLFVNKMDQQGTDHDACFQVCFQNVFLTDRNVFQLLWSKFIHSVIRILCSPKIHTIFMKMLFQIIQQCIVICSLLIHLIDKQECRNLISLQKSPQSHRMRLIRRKISCFPSVFRDAFMRI